MTNHNYGDTATILSVSSAIISVTDFQPIVTMIGSIVAIISGIFAIRYYYLMSKKLKK